MKRASIIFFCLFLLTSRPTFSQGWNSVGTGVNSSVNILYVDSLANDLYVGGSFTNAGGVFASKIARWDGNYWHDLDTGVTVSGFGFVSAIIRFNGDIIAGGQFDTAGNILVNNIARWDGAQWHPMGSGFNANVNALAIYNGVLYAGGTFDSSGFSSTSNFAKWNGVDWVDVAGGMDNSLTSLCVFDGKLYAGGVFTYAGGVAAYKVASYDGTTWQAVDTGFNNTVYKLRVINGTLFALGSFSPVPVNPCRYIAQLVNGEWTQFPLPVFGSVPAIADIIYYDSSVYVVGRFVQPKNIGWFDGIAYQSLDSGLSASGNVLEVFNGDLYVGGNFLNASGVSFTSGIARWVDTVTSLTEVVESNPLAVIYPNPAKEEFTVSSLRFPVEKMELYNLVGEKLFEKNCTKKSKEENIDMSRCSSGLYFVKVITEEGAATLKVVKE